LKESLLFHCKCVLYHSHHPFKTSRHSFKKILVVERQVCDNIGRRRRRARDRVQLHGLWFRKLSAGQLIEHVVNRRCRFLPVQAFWRISPAQSLSRQNSPCHRGNPQDPEKANEGLKRDGMTTEINVAARKCRVAACLKAVHMHTWFATVSTLAVGPPRSHGRDKGRVVYVKGTSNASSSVARMFSDTGS
jgi:hypothetical protein